MHILFFQINEFHKYEGYLVVLFVSNFAFLTTNTSK